METLTKIEKKLVKNQENLNEIDYNMRENYSEPEAEHWEFEANEIEKINKVLEIKRRHVLDRRNSWRAKIIWSVLIPIILSLLISILSIYFGLKPN